MKGVMTLNHVVLAIGIIMLVGLFGIAGFFMYFLNKPGTSQTVYIPSNNPQTPSTGCNLPSAPSVTMTAIDKYAGTTITGVNFAYKRSDATAWTTTGVSGTAFNADPGVVYQIAWAPNNTSTYGELDTYTVPCQSYPTKQYSLANVATSSSASITVWNKDGTVNGNASAGSSGGVQALGQGDLITMPFRVTGVYKYNVGADNQMSVMACKYNSSEVIPTLQGFTQTPVPSIYTTTTGWSYVAWQIPAVDSNADWNAKMIVDATSATRDPAITTGNVSCRIYDTQLYFDNRVGYNNYYFGVQDQNQVDVGSQTYVTVNFQYS